MGNEVSKKYNLSEEHNATAGHCQLWNIFPGHVLNKDKVTTTDISVWMFVRDGLLKRTPIPITDKSTQEQLMQIMKKDMSFMKEKEMQHSGIVKVLEVAEDSRKGMAFVTERIVCSLADLLTRFDHIPGRHNWHANYLEPNGTITDVEISHGFLQIAEALQYMHTVRKKLHMNVSPENIVLTPSGEWKLCGLGFSLSFANDDNKIAIPYYLSPVCTKAMLLEPDLRYMGQELSEGGGTLRYAFASTDLFSLGVTMYEAYRFNLQLARAGRSNVAVINVTNNDVEDHYHRALKDLERLDYSMIPQGVQQILRGMLQLPAHGRIGNIDVINNPFFHSGALAIMRTIGSMGSKDLGGQASVLSSLPSQICDFPPRLLENYVLPLVCKLGVKDPAMWKYTLPLYVFISSKISGQAYARAATSSLTVGLRETNSVDSLVAFVAHTEHLLEKLDREFFSTHVVSMLCNTLDKQGETAAQAAAISVLTKDVVFGAISKEQFLEEVVPRVCRETCKSANFEVKLKGLYFLSVVAARFDAAYVSKNILPSLKHVLGQECTSDMTMAVLGVYNAVLPALSPEHLAANVLPALLPILVNRALSREQFQLATNRVTFLLQTLLTSRTNELGLPPVTVASNEPMKGSFFREQITSSATPLVPAAAPPVPSSGGFGLSSGKGGAPPRTPSKPPAVPSKPPSVPSTVPPSIPPSLPPAMPPAMPPSVPPVPPRGQSMPPPKPPTPSFAPPVPVSSASSSSTGGYVAPSLPPTGPAVSQGSGLGMMGGMGGSMSGGVGGGSNDIDIDDFMSSFSKPAAPSPSSSNAALQSSSKPAPNKTASRLSAPPPGPGGDFFRGVSSTSVGGVSGSAGGSAGGESIEEQIRRTQAEIARLSGSMGGGQSGVSNTQYQQQSGGMDDLFGAFSQQQQPSQGYRPPNQMQQYGNNNFQQQPQGMGIGMGMGGGGWDQQSMPQQSMQRQGGMGMGGGMGGGMNGGGFSSNSSSSSSAPYGSSGGTGYAPPAMSNGNGGGMNNRNVAKKEEDPFDFFN